MADKTETIVILMDREQTALQITKLQEALAAGGDSILMLTSNSKHAERQLRRAASRGEGNLTDLPNPDVIISSAIFTIALPIEPDTFLQVANEWSNS